MTLKSSPFDPNVDLFQQPLQTLINARHALYQLTNQIDWSAIEDHFGVLYCEDNGSPGKPVRLMVGLELLKQLHKLSDEAVVDGWIENPYWQYFCGEYYFQHERPIEPSSLSRFRGRIGPSGGEFLLSQTVQVGIQTKTVKRSDLERITVDTTVQEKAVSFPVDSKLLNRSRERLIKLSRCYGLKIRQSYARKGPQCVVKAGRYGHARQMRRMRAMGRKLKTYLGRVVREIERQEQSWRTDPVASLRIGEELTKAKRLLAQEKTSKNKLYSLHAPEVECISKGKAHKRYEFGVKASIAVTNRSNFVVGGLSLPGNPYDGHTLVTALDQVRRITGHGIKQAYVDKGYRGNDEEEATVYLSGQKRGVKTRSLRNRIKRRQAIEPVIGHLKNEGHLGRNYLHGPQGDEMNVVLACTGYNLRMILRRLKIFCARILCTIHRIIVQGWSFIGRVSPAVARLAPA